MASSAFSFSLDSNEHAHIIAWMDEQSNKSAAIAIALDGHIKGMVTQGQLYAKVVANSQKLDKVEQLLMKLEKRGLTFSNDGGGWDKELLPLEADTSLETNELKRALDRMGAE